LEVARAARLVGGYNLAVIAQFNCDHTTAATHLLKALNIDPRFEAAPVPIRRK